MTTVSWNLEIAPSFSPLPLCVFPSAEGMNAGGYGNLLMNSEQPQGEYGVTIAFLRLITTLVKVKIWLDVIIWNPFPAPVTVVILSAGRAVPEVVVIAVCVYCLFTVCQVP